MGKKIKTFEDGWNQAMTPARMMIRNTGRTVGTAIGETLLSAGSELQKIKKSVIDKYHASRGNY